MIADIPKYDPVNLPLGWRQSASCNPELHRSRKRIRRCGESQGGIDGLVITVLLQHPLEDVQLAIGDYA